MGIPLVSVHVTGTETVVRGGHIQLTCTAGDSARAASRGGTPRSVFWVKDGRRLTTEVWSRGKWISLIYANRMHATVHIKLLQQQCSLGHLADLCQIETGEEGDWAAWMPLTCQVGRLVRWPGGPPHQMLK